MLMYDNDSRRKMMTKYTWSYESLVFFSYVFFFVILWKNKLLCKVSHDKTPYCKNWSYKCTIIGLNTCNRNWEQNATKLTSSLQLYINLLILCYHRLTWKLQVIVKKIEIWPERITWNVNLLKTKVYKT